MRIGVISDTHGLFDRSLLGIDHACIGLLWLPLCRENHKYCAVANLRAVLYKLTRFSCP